MLKPQRQSVSIGTILTPSRPVDQCSGNRFETEFEERTIVDFEQSVRDMDAEIGVDPDQVAVDASGIEQARLGQMGRSHR